MASLKKGIDICFKIYLVLDLLFPPASEHLWIFLQKAVYKINTEKDKVIPSVVDIINKCELEGGNGQWDNLEQINLDNVSVNL